MALAVDGQTLELLTVDGTELSGKFDQEFK